MLINKYIRVAIIKSDLMPVIGIGMNSIEAKKQADVVGGSVKVKSETDLKEVKKHKIPGMESEALSVDFEFKTNYLSPDDEKELANITIEGTVLFVGDKIEETFEKWKKDGTLPEDVSIQVINMILDKCSKKALILSDDLQLPSPIALPFAKKK